MADSPVQSLTVAMTAEGRGTHPRFLPETRVGYRMQIGLHPAATERRRTGPASAGSSMPQKEMPRANGFAGAKLLHPCRVLPLACCSAKFRNNCRRHLPVH